MNSEVRYLEKFLSLPDEKQKKIIDAALSCFSVNGYKKASVSDIASAAGISKSMVFHYFGTKKELYLYLLEHCGKLVESAMRENLDSSVTDFFDRIRHTTDIKIAAIKKHPAIFSFLSSAYFETDEEVSEVIKAAFSKGDEVRASVALGGVDVSKLKEGVDPQLVVKMLVWFAEGYLSELPRKADASVEDMCREFDNCLNLLKNNLYVEKQFI